MRFADEQELEARRERCVEDLARVDSLVRSREGELREVDRQMSDRRRDLEVVIFQVGPLIFVLTAKAIYPQF